MRTCRNPKFRQPADYELKPIIFVVVTHWLDDGSAYHKDRLEVIQTCLKSMRDRAHCDHTFMVWDNGSGHELRDWLRDDFKPDILIQSPNLGKGKARAFAIHMLPLSSVVCYSDDDMFFAENWLKPQLELLEHFPNVSVVSGYPIRTQFDRGIEHTLAWTRDIAKVDVGRYIPDEWEKDHAASVGRSWKKYRKLTENTFDYLINYRGKQAYAQAHHCQFVGRVEQVVKVINVAVEGAMPDEWPLDIAFDEVGLRLCTIDRLCRHVGNVLDESFVQCA